VTEPGLIVIGSGPAGVGAAEAFRKRRADVPVRILTADTDEPYQRPPLSKEFLRGETDDVSLHPSAWFAERDLDVTKAAPGTREILWALPRMGVGWHNRHTGRKPNAPEEVGCPHMALQPHLAENLL